MDPMVLLKGFGLEFLSCLLMVLLLGMAGIPGYTRRVIFTLLVGFLIAFYSQGSLVIWWHQDMGWHTRTLIHDVIGWALVGVILAGFTKTGSWSRNRSWTVGSRSASICRKKPDANRLRDPDLHIGRGEGPVRSYTENNQVV